MAFTKLKQRRSEGFTLVELLIVIVVIAILAAITIISYNGVTQKARTSQSQSAANSVQQVAELYNTDKGHYPVACTDLRDTTLTTKLPTSISLYTTSTSTSTVAATVTLGSPSGTGLSAAPTTPSAVAYDPTASTSGAAPTTSTVTGGVIWYWDYTINGNTLSPVYVGNSAPASGATTVNVWSLTGATSNLCPVS